MRSAVLAGGAASRFEGRPKGLEKVGGTRLLDRVVEVLTVALRTPPIVVANAPHADNWRPDLQTVPDVRTGCGSLGGIYTALTAGVGPVLVVAWDMPFVPEKLLRVLVDRAAPYDVFLPESTGPLGAEPLCAVYSPAAADAIVASLDAEDYRTTGFHAAVRVGHLSLDDVTAFGDPTRLFFNVNEPADLTTAEQLWRAAAAETA